MKRVLKAILPRPLQSLARRILGFGYRLRARFPRSTPRFRTMKYNNPDILQCCIAYNKHGGYCVPLASRDRWPAQWVLWGEVHEPMTIECMTANCRDGDVVHAGAYFGDFLPALSWACGPDALVWSFEPNRENYRCASITLAINGIRNVELFNSALGDRRESRILATSDATGHALGGSSRILSREEDWGPAPANESGSGPDPGLEVAGRHGRATETVQVLTIDEVVPPDRTVSVIHLDLEGHEHQALAGALQTIRRCSPLIIVETLPPEDWLSANILALGYRILPDRIPGNVVLTCDRVRPDPPDRRPLDPLGRSQPPAGRPEPIA